LRAVIKKESPRIKELFITLNLIKRSKVTLAAIVVISAIYLSAILAPLLAPYSPYEMNTAKGLVLPDRDNPLGTDTMGRDVLSRLLYGGRTSLSIGIIAVALIIMIATPLGLISGYYGGIVDEVIMRITDIFMSFPGIILAILFAYVMGRGSVSAVVALSLVQWTSVARLVRGVVISEKEKEYVTAAKALGKSNLRIIWEELLPNVLNPIIVTSTLNIGRVITWVASLSFVGVGVQPPEPDWGLMISEGYKWLMDQPFLAIVPGLFIILTVLSFNTIGDALRDVWDPRIRRGALE
jgi:peptide/nickel transport system permease protein